MSFATDYITAYRLLRHGDVPDDIGRALGYEDKDILLRLRARFGRVSLREAVDKSRVRIFGRIKAAIYAVKMVKEMRRQKVLITNMLGLEQEPDGIREIHKKSINLFPITVHRTVVQMREPKEDA